MLEGGCHPPSPGASPARPPPPSPPLRGNLSTWSGRGPPRPILATWIRSRQGRSGCRRKNHALCSCRGRSGQMRIAPNQAPDAFPWDPGASSETQSFSSDLDLGSGLRGAHRGAGRGAAVRARASPPSRGSRGKWQRLAGRSAIRGGVVARLPRLQPESLQGEGGRNSTPGGWGSCDLRRPYRCQGPRPGLSAWDPPLGGGFPGMPGRSAKCEARSGARTKPRTAAPPRPWPGAGTWAGGARTGAERRMDMGPGVAIRIPGIPLPRRPLRLPGGRAWCPLGGARTRAAPAGRGETTGPHSRPLGVPTPVIRPPAARLLLAVLRPTSVLLWASFLHVWGVLRMVARRRLQPPTLPVVLAPMWQGPPGARWESCPPVAPTPPSFSAAREVSSETARAARPAPPRARGTRRGPAPRGVPRLQAAWARHGGRDPRRPARPLPASGHLRRLWTHSSQPRQTTRRLEQLGTPPPPRRQLHLPIRSTASKAWHVSYATSSQQLSRKVQPHRLHPGACHKVLHWSAPGPATLL